MADIFLSYSRHDRGYAQRLADELEFQGWSVFWDNALQAGDSFDSVLAAELDAAAAVVVLWSESSIRSDWVRDEAEYAKERGALVPVLIHDVRPPLGFGRVQTGDLTTWQGEDDHPGLLELERVVRSALHERPLGGTSAGYYHAQGDPIGTERYWDGTAWQGSPRTVTDWAIGSVSPLAPAGRRVLARLVDFVLSASLTVLGVLALAGPDALSDSANGSPDWEWIVVGLAIGLVFEVALPMKWGASPGKMFFGLQITDAATRASPTRPATAAKRFVIFFLAYVPIVGAVLAAVAWLVSIFLLFRDDERRTIPDRIAGSRVVSAA